MDLYCPKCGEPFEMDYVQHDMTPQERNDFWAGRGCSAECKAEVIEEKDRPMRAVACGVLRDVLGSDVDGIAAELEDLGF